MKKGHTKTHHLTYQTHFWDFVSDPTVSMAFLVFGLIALFLAILEFSQLVQY